MVIEGKLFDPLGLGGRGNVLEELFENLVARFCFVWLREKGGEHLNLGADHDEVFDIFVAKVVGELRDHSGDLFADEADDLFAEKVG